MITGQSMSRCDPKPLGLSLQVALFRLLLEERLCDSPRTEVL